jgi:phosphoglycolate phosphatase
MGKSGEKMIILFDLDGTLIDSTDAIVSTFHHACDEHNFKRVSDEEIMALIGYPLDIMFKSVGVTEDKVWDFVASYKEEYRKISTQKTELLVCAKEAVECANEFATLGIVTTKTGRYSEILMEHFGLMKYFDVLIGREHVEHPKPHAEPILKAMDKLDVDSKEIWMIGDTKLDLICANNAGVNSIAVLSGYGKEDELKQFSDIIFDDALEAVDYLKSRKKQHT